MGDVGCFYFDFYGDKCYFWLWKLGGRVLDIEIETITDEDDHKPQLTAGALEKAFPTLTHGKISDKCAICLEKFKEEDKYVKSSSIHGFLFLESSHLWFPLGITYRIDDQYGHFRDVNAYRYMVVTIVIGFAYTVLPMSFTLYHIATGNKLMGDVKSYLDFLGDQIISYILATGAAVGFGATKDMKSIFAGSGNVDEFFNKGYDSASLLLLGFVCTAILLVWKILA
ncbi:hypothetical protein GH714_010545 [Hevea brasiliensis]|uniref:CASP-like protein n=1 Tax=Hevea brasiliensis TaxID=3981 RepID=A0A6A6N2G1_HEVBR|nr:hypothetical protein GH714_010545 [Hevea brasiliensis]